MKFLRPAALLFVFPLIQACEKQDWKETKMFHDVPKAKGHGQAADGHSAPAAGHEATPAEKK